jgi:hypothetical protein
MAKLLSLERVRRNILAITDKNVQKYALELMARNQNIPPRHGSPKQTRELTSQGLGENAITENNWVEMAIFKANGLTYRTQEGIFNTPASEGMDIYRCVKGILSKTPKLRKKLLPIAKQNGVTLPKPVPKTGT